MLKIATTFVILTVISWSGAEKTPASSCLEHIKDFRSYTHCIAKRDTSRCYDGGCIRCLKGRCRLSCEGDVCRNCPMGDCCDGTNCNVCVDGNCCSTVQCNTCVKDCQESCLSQECRETCTQSCIAENDVEVQKFKTVETFEGSKESEIHQAQSQKFQSVDTPCSSSWGNVLQNPSTLIRRVGESACSQRQTSCNQNSCSTSSCSQSRCSQSPCSSPCSNSSPCSQNTKTITCTNGSCTQSTGCPVVKNCSQNSGCTNGCSSGCSQNGGCSQNSGCSQKSSGCQSGGCQNSGCQNGNCRNECSGRCSGNGCA